MPRQRGIGDKTDQRAMRAIAREREVRGRVGAGQVKVDDVVALGYLKQPAGPAGLGEGPSVVP